MFVVTNRQMSDEEVGQISFRMKSIRMLTGLTQESFAQENDISLTSLKCWEMARAIPRKEGASSYVEALKKNGIDVSLDWIFHGSGPGPTYINGTQLEKPKVESSYIEQQIDFFKKAQLSKGLNPIVVFVQDSEMSPEFKQGDVIGGYYVTISEIKSSMEPEEIGQTPWLVNLGDKGFLPRYLVLTEDEKHIFYRSKINPLLRSGLGSTIGKICWYYRQT